MCNIAFNTEPRQARILRSNALPPPPKRKVIVLLSFSGLAFAQGTVPPPHFSLGGLWQEKRRNETQGARVLC